MIKNKKQLIESVLKTMAPYVKNMMLNENFSGFELIEPSVKRWIDDQIYGDTPEQLEDVAAYLQAKYPGYKMMTMRGQKITQDLVNAYLNDNVPWLNQNFETAISRNNKLTLLSYEYGNTPVIVYFIEYDYEKPFLKNLANLYQDAADFLCEFETEEIFSECCEEAVYKANSEEKQFAYVYEP
jgi:hypothetical protein